MFIWDIYVCSKYPTWSQHVFSSLYPQDTFAKSKHAYHCQVMLMSKCGEVLLGVFDSIIFVEFFFFSLKHTQKIVTLCNVRRFLPVMTSPAQRPKLPRMIKDLLPIFTRHHDRSTNTVFFLETRHLSTCTPSGPRSCVLLLLHKNLTAWINLRGKKHGDWPIWSPKSWYRIRIEHKQKCPVHQFRKNHATPTQKVSGFPDQYLKFYENGVSDSTAAQPPNIRTCENHDFSVRSTNSIK